MTSKFSTEFPDFPAADFPAMPETFVDTSWRNDACPSITSDALGLTIWIDYADPAKREHDGKYLRFSVQNQSAGIETSGGFDTDDWSEVLALIDSKRVAS